jgi:hypothetical protein
MGWDAKSLLSRGFISFLIKRRARLNFQKSAKLGVLADFFFCQFEQNFLLGVMKKFNLRSWLYFVFN